jgi:fission process protein 1
MLFPALTIHSIVKYSAKAIANSKIKTPFVRTWGASLLGLSAIPALPYIFDEPVEHVVDKGFASLHEAIYKNNVDKDRIFKALEDHPHDPAAEIKK